MRFKYLVLLLSIVFLTACSVDYTIDIDHGFREDIIITPDGTSQDSRILSYNQKIAIYDDENIEDIETGGLVGNVETYKYRVSNNKLNVSAKYGDFTSYIKSSTFKSCFNKAIPTENKNSNRIDTDNIFKCFDDYSNFNEITIKFVTTKYVIEHNADTVNGDTYIWTFKKTDPKNKSIIFEYTDKSEKDYKKSKNNSSSYQRNSVQNNKDEENVKKNNTLLFILCLFLSFLIIFGIMVFRKKN